jgi:hypothetical protein
VEVKGEEETRTEFESSNSASMSVFKSNPKLRSAPRSVLSSIPKFVF